MALKTHDNDKEEKWAGYLHILMHTMAEDGLTNMQIVGLLTTAIAVMQHISMTTTAPDEN